MHARSVFFLVGIIVICVGLSLAGPVAVSLIYGEAETAVLLAKAMLLVAGLGLIVGLIARPRRGEKIQLGNREGVAVVGLSWIFACIAGALPYVLAAHVDFAQAVFETASGFTTTGATVFADIESLPRGILFWRSLTHWLGGMGIIVFSLAILPFMGAGGMQLYKAEVTGPLKDKVAPRLADTARSLWFIYVLLTALLTLALRLEGMNLFEAVNHAFSTIATGGFSTRNASAAVFSPLIQWTLIIFMALAGMNFGLHYLALRGRPIAYARSTECLAYMGLIAAGSLIIAVLLFRAGGGGAEESLRAAAFQVVSLCTTTGFITSDYLQWPLLTQGILLFFILIGASAGSTAGGIKVMRLVVVYRAIVVEMRRLVHPHVVEHVKMDGRSLPAGVLQGVLCFVALYLGLNFFGGLWLMAEGQDFLTAFSAASTCLSNVGPGFGAVGPVFNFGFLPDSALHMLSLLMVLGRLEIFTLLLLFLPRFWKS